MVLKDRRVRLLRADDLMLIYAALFLVCAVISALGAGWLGVACFVPVVVIIELTQSWGKWSDQPESDR